MSRSARLFDLLQLLRRHRRPVAGAAIAAALGVSARTVYRDIATLQAQGARIDGAPGLGYVLRPGFVLPPLMFTADEVEALVLGVRWVAGRGDSRLADAARDALAKVAAGLPDELRIALETSTLLVAPAPAAADGGERLAQIRQAIRLERKLTLSYCDAGGRASERTVWPFAIGYFERAQVVVAWCELRAAIRHFRTDRIAALRTGAQRYPQRRHALMALWREQEGLDPRSGTGDAADGI